MTKAELVAVVAAETDLPAAKVGRCFDAVVAAVVEALARGDRVELRGFGSFHVRSRGPRVGRNPKTGSAVDVPAKKVPYFKPGKDLRERLAGGDWRPIVDSRDLGGREAGQPAGRKKVVREPSARPRERLG